VAAMGMALTLPLIIRLQMERMDGDLPPVAADRIFP
jgi:hypothetical protein